MTDNISIRTAYQGGRVSCWICDSGIGIPPGLADKIFEPFFTTKEVGKGTGLGLSISYGIVQECDGRISAVPRKDGGACFILSFNKAQTTKNGGLK